MKAIRIFTSSFWIGIFLCILSIPISDLHCQAFEGTITYSVNIENANPHEISDSIFALMYKDMPPMTYTYYYKENRYKSVRGDEDKEIEIYNPVENKIYTYREGSEDAFWTEWNDQAEINRIKEKQTILGLECEAVIIRTNNVETTLYFSKGYKIDTSKLKENNAWEKYLRIAGSVPLKLVMRGGARHLTVLTAISVKEEKLDSNIFHIPNFRNITKTPY